jgi:hypothetical protein
MSRLLHQLEEALRALSVCEQPPALIGGLAVVAHKVIRATTDIDLLVAIEDADRIHDVVLALGYQCIFRSQDAVNYKRGDERLDLLYSYPGRESAALLREAEVHNLPIAGNVKIISPEGLIGFKVGGYLGSEKVRTKDLEDIREILRLHRGSLDMAEVRRYFGLYPEGPPLLQQVLTELNFVESDLDE